VKPQKIILYYGFTPLDDPEAIRLWQRTLCEKLSLKGRILISRHGINGTLGGDLDDLRRYIAATKEFPGFKGIDFKWSEGSADDFPRLRVRVRDEIVSFGASEELEVDQCGVVGSGVHLNPQEIHELVDQRGDDVVFFDARNAFEAEIGRFKNAVVPHVRATRDFASMLDSGRYDDLKQKAVVTYCTGGVRCEVLSALMTRRGFEASCATAKPMATTDSGRDRCTSSTLECITNSATIQKRLAPANDVARRPVSFTTARIWPVAN
jgi:UPF0176 protein